MKDHKPYICILDALTTNPGDLSWSALQNISFVDVFDRTAPEELLERAKGKEILITNKVNLTEDLLSKLPECKLICLLSTGTNAVDLDFCKKKAIPVCNIPAYSTDSVAELVLAFLLEWAKGVSTHSDAVRQGAWTKSKDFSFTLTPQRELKGMTLGLVGFGSIAQAVCRIAIALGMNVLSYTPNPQDKPDLGQEFTDLDTLVSRSQILSLHCPLTGQTDGIIDKNRLSQMPKGSVLVNTGRGGLLQEQDVADALSSGHLSAACLDVLSTEPPQADNPLLQAPNAMITPHIAWATQAARSRLIDILTGNVQAYLTGNPTHVVNGL